RLECLEVGNSVRNGAPYPQHTLSVDRGRACQGCGSLKWLNDQIEGSARCVRQFMVATCASDNGVRCGDRFIDECALAIHQDCGCGFTQRRRHCERAATKREMPLNEPTGESGHVWIARMDFINDEKVA